MSSKLDMFIRSASEFTDHPFFRFSLPSLNLAIGNKDGIHGGRALQLVGKPSSGKSTLALDLIKNAQQGGFQCAYIDFERSYDPKYATLIGVDNENVLLGKTDTAEQGLELTEHLIKDRDVKLIVIDSISAAVPSAEYEKGYSDAEKVAVAAGFLTRFSKRITPVLDNYGALLVLINQMRANMSPMSRKDTKPYGPWALFHMVSISLELERIKNEGTRAHVRANVAKNKTGAERGMTEYFLVHGKGLDVPTDILQIAIKYGIVDRKGAWYLYKDQKAQGIESAALSFPLYEIEKKIYETIAKAS